MQLWRDGIDLDELGPLNTNKDVSLLMRGKLYGSRGYCCSFSSLAM